MGRVLIVKFGAIGDVVMAIPAAYEMHRRGFAVDWVCGLQVLPVLQLYPWIRPIAVDDRALFQGGAWERMVVLTRLWSVLLGQRYELLATLYYDPRYAVVGLPVRAKRKVRMSRTDRRRSLLHGRHHTDEYLRVMLGEDEGPRPVGLAPRAAEGLSGNAAGLSRNVVERDAGRERILLVPGGARNSMRRDDLRRWPVASYVEVARRLRGLDLEVVLAGGPEDGWVSEAFSQIGVRDEVGRLTLVETLALMDASDVVVTHDTGPLHLAGLTSAGIVGIFGPTDPRGRLPQRRGTVAIWGGEGFACRPCYDGHSYAACGENLCVQQVTPEMVVRAVEELLVQRRSGELLPPRVVSPASTVTESLAGGAGRELSSGATGDDAMRSRR